MDDSASLKSYRPGIFLPLIVWFYHHSLLIASTQRAADI